jgi:uncharacterized membrane protein YraQ (UPF0718 family)
VKVELRQFRVSGFSFFSCLGADMKKLMVGLSSLLVSAPLLAHVGDHNHSKWLEIAMHLISEHALPLLLVGVVLGGLIIKRMKTT